MAKEKYMALADVQSLWTNPIKPWIASTYVNKNSDAATVDTCIDIINELV